MAIDLSTLLDGAFYRLTPVQNATQAIERARERRPAGLSFEVVAPPAPDEAWLRQRLLSPLVYFCESEGRPLPACGGVFLSLFVGDALYALDAGAVIAWAGRALGLTPQQLDELYGTHEIETVLR